MGRQPCRRSEASLCVPTWRSMGRQVEEVVAQAPVADCAPGAANVEIMPRCGDAGAG